MRLDSDILNKRKFVNGKISKVKFITHQDEKAKRFVTGFWDSPCNSLCCWDIVENEETNDDSLLQCVSEIKTNSDIMDICVTSGQSFVAGLSNGSLKFVGIDKDGKMFDQDTSGPICKGAITTLCVVGKDVFAGTDTGHIVNVSPLVRGRSSTIFASNLMGICSFASCGPNQFISGHLTGQMHLWDVRAKQVAFTVPDPSYRIPELSKAASTLNDAITAIASHPAEPNVIAYGTGSGSVSFIDIRNPDEIFPSLFKIAKDSINNLKFNPSYPANFFSSSGSSVVHWDASLSNTSDTRKSLDGLNSSFATEDVLMNSISFGANSKKTHLRTNIWLSSKIWDLVQLKALLEDDPKYISTFDVSRNAIIVGSNTSNLVLLDNINF